MADELYTLVPSLEAIQEVIASLPPGETIYLSQAGQEIYQYPEPTETE